jgi:hypothetical protein
MGDEALAMGLVEVKEAVAAQTAGLMQMLNILATQTKMLTEILQAVTAEPQGETPLLQAMKQLIAIAESHSTALERIENMVAKPGAR